ncbi:hypothetical protein HA402_005964 [Bradysia odoriphaga]|nr:hypothetical protein HA402_005964 [Bradysia odoriphaga]
MNMSNIVQNKYFPAINFRHFGLLVSVVFVATISVIQVDAIECGTVNLYREAMLGGEEVKKDEWPFIAALYYTTRFKYFCGGTLISHKHVLTAAHCIQAKAKSVPLPPDEITVRLGAYNLTDRSEVDVVDKSVTRIHLHPDWQFNEEKYDADIAILVLNENISFSNHIRPVCMPPGNYLIDGLVGTVVGWGETENGTAEGIPKKIEINALNDTFCYETDKGIARYASERSFCGEGSGTPNAGDSGGGFFAVDGSGWVQFGTVSFVRPKATGNIRRVAIYMKLTSLRDWIAGIVEQSGDTIGMATTKADLHCTYEYTDDVYGCRLFDLNIRRETFVVKNFTGSHSSDRDNEDVEAIAFETGVMVSLPLNIGSFFNNLKSIAMSVDTSRILRSNFQNMERLEGIQIVNSIIRELDEKTLWDLPNLQSFRLEKNELKLLHPAIFSRNSKLEKVKVSLNALKSLPRNLFRTNFQLWYVSFEDNAIETIDDSIFETNANLRAVELKGNHLRHVSENLFRNNSELRFVDLSRNRIKTIDEQTFAANSKLWILALSLNELEFLPAQILRGKAFLEELHLNENSLKTIEERFFETNVRIKKIYLHVNQLTLIPDNLFRNNSQLQFVHLDANSIEAIDENLFENSPLLQDITFPYNRLLELPRNLFRHNSKLESVNFSTNSLETIDERTFVWNPRLREINFGNNQVVSLPEKLFHNNSLLATVRFDGNSLVAIDEHTFRTNTNLQEVYFSLNLLNYLPEKLFHNNPLLRIVDFSGNYFATFYENIFSTNANLEKIILQGGTMLSLPKNLFQGNSRLQYIDFRSHRLKFIETNFTVLKHANYINLSGNDCINAAFYNGESDDTHMFTDDTRSTKNLTEFQDIVTSNC